jgi:type I restriction enzyme, S subunit
MLWSRDSAAMQLHQQWREGHFEEVCNHHVSQASVGTKTLLETKFLLPPLAEQKRIVAKVEALLERTNAARARLTKVPAIVKRFRQSVLAAACSGQLTADWRGQRADTPNSVLPLIAAARQTRLSNQDPRSKHRLADNEALPHVVHPSEFSESGFPDIPDDWSWVRCGDLCQPERALTYGVIKLGPEVDDGVPTLRSSDVRWLRIEEDHVKRISPGIAAQFSRTFLQGGEVLITVRGTLGGVAVTPAHMKGFNVSREVAVVPVEAILEPWFVAFAVAADWSQNWLSGVTKGVAYTGVNIEDLRRLPLPIPPIPEQREIVRRVEALFTRADGIEDHVRVATAPAEHLPQAILARAFRGELVPTEAELAVEEGRDYEPASVLLERIQESRKQNKPAKSGRGGNNMAKRSSRQPAKARRSLEEVLREQGKPLTPEGLFDLAGFDEDSVDGFYEQLRKLIEAGKVRENRPNRKDVTLEAVGT